MDTRGQQQIVAGMGLGMHLPVTSGLWPDPNIYVDSSSPVHLQSARLSWSTS